MDLPSKKKVIVIAALLAGLSHIIFFKQYIKGSIFALFQLVFIFFLPRISNILYGVITLGHPAPHLPIMQRDHSMFMLIDGVAMFALVVLFFVVYAINIKDVKYMHETLSRNGRIISSDKTFVILGLLPSVLLVVFLIIVPLIFAALVAFTNYSAPFHIPPANTVDWVGFDNFRSLFGGQLHWTGSLVRVALWTVTWAALATLTTYFGGMTLAVIMKEFNIKFASVFRTIFILPYAVPAVISMLIWRNLLNSQFGAINRTLIHFGLISEGITWLGSEAMVRFSVVMINLWVGFPYFMLLILGTMTAISQDVFDAARIDGANKFQVFKSISLPLITYQTMPLIIMSFTHNINNFGAIYFLTGGGPPVHDTAISSAGASDILITWIYGLTMNTMRYNYASVLAIMIFIMLAPFAIFNFMRTKSFKEGEV